MAQSECHSNDRWSCPIPPAENRLSVRFARAKKFSNTKTTKTHNPRSARLQTPATNAYFVTGVCNLAHTQQHRLKENVTEQEGPPPPP